MKSSERTIKRLREIITGDKAPGPAARPLRRPVLLGRKQIHEDVLERSRYSRDLSTHRGPLATTDVGESIKKI
jgi:hypothetical protein